MKDVVGVGSLNKDLIYEVEGLEIAGRAFTPGGEAVGTQEQFGDVLRTVEREGHLLQKSGGGSAANTVYSMSRMGFSAGFIGTVGNDEDGDFLVRSMGKVDCTHVKRTASTGKCISLIAEQDRSLILLPNANDHLTITGDDLEYANGFSIVHLSSFVSDAALKEQIGLVGSFNSDVLVSFDPGEIYAKKGLDAIQPIDRTFRHHVRQRTGAEGDHRPERRRRCRGPDEDGADDGRAQDGGGRLDGVLWWRQPFYPCQES